ncbi:MAG: FtsW/RodA/SpoVE family cell cycle protein [Candidatus Liptonbacteria bacterium]|nr:FtsW/RodA/SpoVE family cell cycle protein [Candidatus Liptonbacteria bacterium]
MKASIAMFLGAGFIVLAGLLTLSSIALQLFISQLIWVVLGGSLIFAFLYFDWRSMFQSRSLVWVFYALAIGLLVFAYIAAPTIRNTKSWLVFGPIRFQPVEFAKIALILVYASYFSRRHLTIARFSSILGSFFLFLLMALLTLKLNDTGSAIVLFGIWLGFLLVSGLPRKWIIFGLIAILILGPLVWVHLLKDYQKARVIGVFNPDANSLGVNYSATQSKIAIGSAGLWGKGYGQGPQTQLGFLTEPATDFIFPAFVEEWGIVAGTVLIAAFLVLILSILRIGLIAEQNTEKFICMGAVIVLGLHLLLNGGMTVGLTPVVGVPFPFLSYGGSNILMNFLLLAIINAISRKS